MKKLNTTAVMAMVLAVLAEADKSTYSVSRVFAAYNFLFEKNEEPQSCPSCLKSRVDLMRAEVARLESDAKHADAAAQADLAKADAERAAAMEVKGAEVLSPETGIWFEEVTNVGDFTKVTGRQIEQLGEGLGIPGDDVEVLEMDVNDPELVAPAKGVVRFPMAEGQPIDFTPSGEDGKGLVAYADGTKVKAGTYDTATGDTIAVQPGGKATVKPAEDLT